MNTPLQNTIVYLKACRKLRDAGKTASFITDPAWLVHMAINRRAGWPDDPGCFRGSAMPVDGKYPRKAVGEVYNHLRNSARDINTPRLRVYWTSLGEWRKLIMSRIPGRITMQACE